MIRHGMTRFIAVPPFVRLQGFKRTFNVVNTVKYWQGYIKVPNEDIQEQIARTTINLSSLSPPPGAAPVFLFSEFLKHRCFKTVNNQKLTLQRLR